MSSSIIRTGAATGVDAMRSAFTRENDVDDTKFMRLGRAAHCKVLTPLIWSQSFPVLSRCQATKADGATCTNGASYTAVVDGDVITLCGVHRRQFNATDPYDYVKEAELPAVEAMATKLGRVAELNGNGSAEVTYIADVGGVRCKVRMDFEGTRHIADLKTCTDYPTLDSMERTISDRGYYIQAALYLRVHAAITGTNKPWVWIFQQTVPPYATNAIWADPQTIEIGNADVDRVLSQWSTAMQSGRFPDPYDMGYRLEGGVNQWKRREYESIAAASITFEGEAAFSDD